MMQRAVPWSPSFTLPEHANADDLESTARLEEILRESRLYETNEEAEKRAAALEELGQIINRWVRKPLRALHSGVAC